MAAAAGGAGVAPPVLGVKETLLEAAKTPAGMAGFGMLLSLLVVVAYVPIAAPFDVVEAWQEFERWEDNPRFAAPVWVDYLTSEQKARTVLFEPGDISKRAAAVGDFQRVVLTKTFEWNYDEFPSQMELRFFASWPVNGTRPIADVIWHRPDGESLRMFLGSMSVRAPAATIIDNTHTQVQERTEDWALALGAEPSPRVRPAITLFAQTGPDMLSPTRAEVLKGTYTVEVLSFLDAEGDIDLKFVAHGTVHGLAGTDGNRRDLLVGVLWGAPVALAFGAAAALMTVFSQVILGALGAYYGGRWDEIIQRSTDFVIIVPALPILILIGAFYQLNLLHILFVVVAFSILGGSTKVVRSIVLQVKEELYVESAKSYGAPRARILMKHILPRTLPYTFALLALAVPSFIFLEAALAFLDVGDPVLPTWGKVLGDAYRGGAIFAGFWWWIGIPTTGILYTTVAFAFLGYAFDKVLNPRLREQ